MARKKTAAKANVKRGRRKATPATIESVKKSQPQNIAELKKIFGKIGDDVLVVTTDIERGYRPINLELIKATVDVGGGIFEYDPVFDEDGSTVIEILVVS